MKRVNSFIPILILILAVGLWIGSLRSIDPLKMNDLGLISVLPVTYLLALAVLAVGYAMMFLKDRLADRLMLVYMLALVLIIHATPAIVYGTLRYAWAYKHIGIVDYIIRHGSVDPTIAMLRVYQNWPGFFALNALLTQLSGLNSPMSYAAWAPPFFNMIYVLALLLIMKMLTPDRRVAWFAVWLFELTNWIGQDYFAPQSLSYFLYMIILGILLARFNSSRPFPFQAISRARPLRWLNPVMGRMSALFQTGRPTYDLMPPWQRIGYVLLVLTLFVTIVATHQLTPIMAIIAILLLIVFRYMRWWTLPFWMGTMTLLWFMFPASFFFQTTANSLLRGVGTLGSNISTSLIDLGSIGQEQATIAVMTRIMTAAIALLAAAGFIRRILHGFLDLPALLLVVAPAFSIVLGAYGGEILFRVYFFALPFLAYLAASLFFTDPAKPSTTQTAVNLFSVSLVLGAVFLFAYFGRERLNYSTPKEVAAFEYLSNIAEPNSLLVEGSHDYPTQFHNYEYFVYVPMDREPRTSIDRVVANPIGVLDEWMSDRVKYKQTYLILTRSQEIFVDSIHSMPPGSLERIRQALLKAKGFELLYHNEDASIYIHPN
jgi:hypothetical protein